MSKTALSWHAMPRYVALKPGAKSLSVSINRTKPVSSPTATSEFSVNLNY